MFAWSVEVDIDGMKLHAIYVEEGDIIIFDDGKAIPSYEVKMTKQKIVEFPISFFQTNQEVYYVN